MKTLENVVIICASKYFSTIEMGMLLQKGVEHFGENRVDSFLEKFEKLSHEKIFWHFIGHLQRNKAKQIISKLDYLHTLDSLALAEVIQGHREKPLNCFVQINATHEAQKHGITLDEVPIFMLNIKKYDKINVVGFMSMGKQDDAIETKNAFDTIEQLRVEYNLLYTSMGMSDDYLIALESNATHLRLGRYFKQFLEG
jgi:pyridoxal phosphate enzyme (YggS family)